MELQDTVISEQRIDEQSFAENARENINDFKSSSKQETHDHQMMDGIDFEDLTDQTSYEVLDDGPLLSMDEVNHWFRIFDQTRLCVVSTYPTKLLHHACCELMNHEEAGRKPLFWKFEYSQPKNKVAFSLKTLIQSGKWPQGSWLYVALCENDWMFLVKLLIEQREEIYALLRKYNKHLLFSIPQPGLEQFKKYPSVERFENDIWIVDYLKCYLMMDYGDEEGLALYGKVQRQIKLGYWGEDSEVHLSLLDKYSSRTWREDILEAEEEVTELEEMKGNPKLKHVTDKVKDLLDLGELERILLFVGTFFTRIDYEKFEKVIRIVIQGRTIEVEKEKEIVTKKGKIKKIKEIQQIKMFDHWKARQNEYFHELGFQIVETEEDREIVTFKALRKSQFKTAFLYLYRPFFNQMIQDIMQDVTCRPLYGEGVICECVFSLLIDMAQRNPEYFGDEALWRVFENLKEVIRHLEESQASGNALLGGVILQYHLGEMLLLRNLIEKMLLHKKLVGAVDSFLRRLLNEGHYSDLASLLGLLRQTAAFNELVWMKGIADRLSDRADHPALEQLHDFQRDFLKSMAADGGGRFKKMLLNLRDWFPGPHESPNKASGSQRLALRVLVEHVFQTQNFYHLSLMEDLLEGDQTATHPLIEELLQQNESIFWALFVDVLFHPWHKTNCQAEENGLLSFTQRVAFRSPTIHLYLNEKGRAALANASDRLLDKYIEEALQKRHKRARNEYSTVPLRFGAAMLIQWRMALLHPMTDETNPERDQAYQKLVHLTAMRLGDELHYLILVLNCMAQVYGDLRKFFQIQQLPASVGFRGIIKKIDHQICLYRANARSLIQDLKT